MNIVGTFINNGEYRDIHEVGAVNMGAQAETKEEGNTTSPVHLNSTIGTKIDFIRVMNTLYELGFFTNEQGGKITKKDFFTSIGQAVNIDLSKYDKDLSRSTADSTALEKHLRVFDNMRQKMIDIFNSK